MKSHPSTEGWDLCVLNVIEAAGIRQKGKKT
mgnify:CR=1 FL=1